MILKYLNKQKYTIVDVIGQSAIMVLVYDSSWYWTGLIIPLIIIKHLLKRWNDLRYD